MLSPDQIMGRLEEIEKDLGERQNEYAEAAENRHKLVRDFELRAARAGLAARADTATEKKWKALVEIAAADDSLYEDLANAEGAYEGAKAAVRVLETRANIGMSLLKAHGRAA